jgi:mono/diheme cytochrome c family protein
MKKILKIIGIGVASIVALMVVAVGAVFVISESRMGQTFNVPAAPIAVPSSPEAIAEGQRIATYRACSDCHGEDLGGKVFLDGPIGFAMGSNLTAGQGGIGKTYTDADFARAVRHGVRPDNKGIVIMPSTDYYNMSDTDAGYLIAYMRSLPPVDREHKPSQMGLLFRALYVFGQVPLVSAELIDHQAKYAEPTPAVTNEFGEYLSKTCTGCHTATFAGGPIPGRPANSPHAANLTPAGNMSQWTEQDFITLIRTGARPNGTQIDNGDMPWQSFAKMNDTELKALFMYLRTLPPAETKK